MTAIADNRETKTMGQQVNHVTEILTHPGYAVPPVAFSVADYVMHVTINEYLAVGSAVLLTLNLSAWAWKGIKAFKRAITKTRRQEDED